LPGSFSVNEDGSYRIEFHAPRDIAEHGTQTDVRTETGLCNPQNGRPYNRTIPITPNRRFQGQSIAISGRLDPGHPGTFSGTLTLKEPRPTPGKPLPASSTRPGAPTAVTVITWKIQRGD
jgi:hypothetical protein